jgi:hypothetical protein
MFARMKSNRGSSKSSLLLELLLIVIGINSALWFEGLAEDFREAKTEQQYLQGLSSDLKTDVKSLDYLIEANEKKLEKLETIIPQLPNLTDATEEQQGEAVFTPPTYHFFQASDFTYIAMQESGDFRLLSDPGTKKNLLRLVRQYRLIDELQVNFMQALDDAYIPLMMASFDLQTSRITNPTLTENQIFLNFFAFTMQETSQRVTALKKARKQAAELLEGIEKQLD